MKKVIALVLAALSAAGLVRPPAEETSTAEPVDDGGVHPPESHDHTHEEEPLDGEVKQEMRAIIDGNFQRDVDDGFDYSDEAIAVVTHGADPSDPEP